ncbi:MAG: ATPase, T2SS/T4P/T4SS family [Deltaproteobacteria bacterium]|nr:ATPase, T2SS/T4P/T4SS family [Deltaproteobacteria bacterium]
MSKGSERTAAAADRAADEALLRFLAKHGQIEAWSRQAIDEYMRQHGVAAIEALCDGGFVGEDAVTELFQQHLRLPRVDLSARPALPRPIDPALLRQHLVVPAAIDNGRLLVAMANPLDYEAIKRLHFASGLRVVPAIAPLSEVRAALPKATQPAADDAPHSGAAAADDAESSATVINSPIVKMAALMIEQGIAQRASDIHLEPTLEGLTLRYRIDGVLEEVTRVSTAVRNPLVARLKVMAKLDIAERRIPQDGGVTVTVDGRRIDCRVSTLPTQYGEKVVIRLLDATRALAKLDHLGFEPGEMSRVSEVLSQSEGMILTTGPTGSGKSTTLYAMLQAILSPELNIVTVENPIEYRLPGINQTEVNERQGMTFAAALRSILRQDPDVILVGEIRDKETAEIAIQAAQTGHLVLSTLHTNDSVGAITRLTKLGIDRELIASTLLMVIAQRLVRRVCEKCGAPTSPDEWNHVPFRKALGDHPVRRGSGCAECRGGFRGRVGVYEILRNTLEMKRLIVTGASEVELRDQMRRQGGRTLMQVALEKIRLGRTTPDEVAAVIKSDEGVGNCPGCGAEVDERFHACPYCGNTLRNDCAGCGAPLQDGWERCPSCGTLIAGHVEAAAEPEQKPTVVTMVAPKALAVGSVLGAGTRGLIAAGGLDESGAAEVELAVVEACGLACAASDGGELRIEIEVSRDGCNVCLSDEGPPWAWPRPNAKIPGLEAFTGDTAPEVRAFLIRSSVDEASYERVDRTNRLWLIKRSAAASPAMGVGHVELTQTQTHH